ncbi:MAG: hypothetical protein HY289_00445 [Planctomycetes bacterium]|nr:hypothetical protein [Planctomycetota bacterium]
MQRQLQALLSSLHFTWLARVGRIDMPLTTAITVALGSFYLGNRDGASRTGWHALGYVALGFGLLLKGPIAVVLPAVVAACGLAFAWRHANAKRQVATLCWGVPLMLAIAAPWYIWANSHTDGRLWDVFFWYHNVERGLGGSETLKSHPWWLYVPVALFDLLPWSLVLPAALWWFWRNREARQDNAAWFGLIWFAAITLFLSCMSFKRADYLLPAYPGLAIFLGVCIERWLRGSEPEAQAREDGLSLACASGSIRITGVAFMLVYLVGWQVYDRWIGPVEDYRPLARDIRGHTTGPVIFFRAESHPLMFHLGKPVDTILEWENLEWWVDRPTATYFIMPQACADAWNAEHAGLLEVVLRANDHATSKHDRTLVVVRSRGQPVAKR